MWLKLSVKEDRGGKCIGLVSMITSLALKGGKCIGLVSMITSLALKGGKCIGLASMITGLVLEVVNNLFTIHYSPLTIDY